MKNKRAQAAITAVLVVGLIIAMVVFFENRPYQVVEQMGEKQNALLSSYAEAESARSYMKSAARNSLHQAIYSHSLLGGFQKSESDESHLSCSLQINGDVLQAFKCFENPGKSEPLCKIYNISYDKSQGQSFSRKLEHEFYCANLDQEYYCICEKNNKTMNCNDLPEEDEELQDWEVVSCDNRLNSKKAVCSIYYQYESVYDLPCNQENEFCSGYNLPLGDCPLEGCDFIKDLDVVCEPATGEKLQKPLSECGKTASNYPIWKNATGECYPSEENASDALLADFQENFEYYLSLYNTSETKTLQTELKYDYEIRKSGSGLELVATPETEEIQIFNIDTLRIEPRYLKSKLTLVDEEFNFKYSVDSCFSVSADYPLFNYDLVVEKVRECISQENCFSLNNGEYAGFNWHVTADNASYTLFDLEPANTEPAFICSNNKIKESKPVLKFAVLESQVHPAL